MNPSLKPITLKNHRELTKSLVHITIPEKDMKLQNIWQEYFDNQLTKYLIRHVGKS